MHALFNAVKLSNLDDSWRRLIRRAVHKCRKAKTLMLGEGGGERDNTVTGRTKALHA